jgi:hypothetical protein
MPVIKLSDLVRGCAFYVFDKRLPFHGNNRSGAAASAMALGFGDEIMRVLIVEDDLARGMAASLEAASFAVDGA